MDRDKFQKMAAKKSDRGGRKDDRRNYKLDKINAVTQKSLAVAAKRKWLVFLIGLAIVAYFLISSNAGGILTKVKSFF